MLLPVIAPKAAFMFTVTIPAVVVVEITATLLGMAVEIPCPVSVLVGPASMEVMMAVSGAGAATTRGVDVSWLLELRKNTLTGTRDDGFGWVVVVVGRCGSSRSNGTFEGAMVLGALCVGMAQPEARKVTATRSTPGRTKRRRLTRRPPDRPRRATPAG